MSRRRKNREPQKGREAYPGIGLAIGAGIGLVLGLLIEPDSFFIFAGIGAMAGLIGGAIVDLRTRS